MWINATCHPEYGSTFGVDIDSLPGLLLTKPHRRYFVTYSGGFDARPIAEFIDKSLTGRLSFSPYSRFNDLDQRICARQSKDETKNNVADNDEGKDLQMEQQGDRINDFYKKRRRINEDL